MERAGIYKRETPSQGSLYAVNRHFTYYCIYCIHILHHIINKKNPTEVFKPSTSGTYTRMEFQEVFPSFIDCAAYPQVNRNQHKTGTTDDLSTEFSTICACSNYLLLR